MQKRFLMLLTVLLALAMVASGCSKAPDAKNEPAPSAGTNAGTPVKGGTFTYAYTADVSQMLPTYSQDTASAFMQRLVFDSLLRLNDKWEWQPWVATGLPAITNDGKTYTFNLRKDVKFHDGQPLTAKDVQFTFQQVYHPGYNGVRASNFTRLRGVTDLRKLYSELNGQVEEKKLTREEADKQKLAAWQKWCKESGAVEAPDDYTVVFNLDKTFGPLLNYVAGVGIMPKHLLESQLGKMKESEFARAPIGSGQYKFDEWKTQDKIVLKANDDWWGGRPNIDTFIWKVYPDSNTAMAALEKGEVDYTTLEYENIPHFKNDVKSVNVLIYPSTNYRQLSLDVNNDLFKDVKVRHALAYTVDKELIVKQLLQGYGKPAWVHGLPDRFDYNPDIFKPAYDPKKAEALLDEAGWTKGSDGFRAKEGKRFAFDLYFTNASKTDVETAQVLQEAWKKLGIDVNLQAVDEPTLMDISDAGNPERKQPPMYIYGWALGVEPDPYAIWACDGSFNDIGYCSQKADELIEKGRDESDQSKRKVIYQEFQATLAQDQPYIWLYYYENTDGLAARVKGPITGNSQDLFWNFGKWWIEGK